MNRPGKTESFLEMRCLFTDKYKKNARVIDRMIFNIFDKIGDLNKIIEKVVMDS